jgi:hypothetical protein
MACTSYCCAGNFTKGLEHADKVLNLYDDEKHRHLAEILNEDLKTVAGIFGSMCTWILGYPDRALRLSNEKDAHARWGGHPFGLGFALTNGSHLFDQRFGHNDLRKRGEECERLGRDNSLLVLWAVSAPISFGQALIREGKPAEGIIHFNAGIAAWEANGGESSTTWNAFLAEGMALTGDIDNALQLLDEQIAQIERPGWEERLYYAEILRL